MMNKKFLYLLFTGWMILFLAGCQLDTELGTDTPIDHQSTDVTALHDLKYTNHFRDGSLEHILEGELNQKGQAVGYHYDRLPSKKGEIISGTETSPNEVGIYEAEVTVSDVEKQSNGGKSTFFPDQWDTQEVVNAINEAYDNKTFINGNTFEGLTSDGVAIRMYLDDNEQIISAFPVY